MPRLRHLAVLLILAAPATVQATSACHIRGQVAGIVIDECTQIDEDAAAEPLKQQCNGKVPGLEQLGGRADARALAACPGGAAGVCENPGGAQARIHYYGRSPEQLAAVRQACEMQRGRWVAP